MSFHFGIWRAVLIPARCAPQFCRGFAVATEHTVTWVDAAKVAVKKLVAQVHPDLFSAAPSARQENEASLKCLQSALLDLASEKAPNAVLPLRFWVQPRTAAAASELRAIEAIVPAAQQVTVRTSQRSLGAALLSLLQQSGVQLPSQYAESLTAGPTGDSTAAGTVSTQHGAENIAEDFRRLFALQVQQQPGLFEIDTHPLRPQDRAFNRIADQRLVFFATSVPREARRRVFLRLREHALLLADGGRCDAVPMLFVPDAHTCSFDARRGFVVCPLDFDPHQLAEALLVYGARARAMAGGAAAVRADWDAAVQAARDALLCGEVRRDTSLGWADGTTALRQLVHALEDALPYGALRDVPLLLRAAGAVQLSADGSALALSADSTAGELETFVSQHASSIEHLRRTAREEAAAREHEAALSAQLRRQLGLRSVTRAAGVPREAVSAFVARLYHSAHLLQFFPWRGLSLTVGERWLYDGRARMIELPYSADAADVAERLARWDSPLAALGLRGHG